MKTVDEVLDWHDVAAREFEDPATPIGQIFPRYKAVPPEHARDELIATFTPSDDPHGGTITLNECLDLSFDVDARGLPLYRGGMLVAFGLEKITDSVWSLHPSLNIPGVIHAFVVIYDVPSPAPWERKIIT